MSLTGSTNEEKIWNFLKNKINNNYGVAGLMGNLYAESGLNPKNLQNSYENKLGYTDSTYTTAVDNGTYTNFSSDSAGYGLAQWTYSTRKKGLLEYIQEQKLSIGDLEGQLNYLYKELQSGYSSTLSALKNATSVKEASDAVLTKYERPADQSDSVKTKRAEYGQKYYDKYATSVTTTTNSNVTSTTSASTTTSTTSTSTSSSSSSTTSSKTATDKAASYDKSLAGTYKTIDTLNVRNGAGTNKSIMVTIPKGTSVTNYGYYTTNSNVKWLYVQFTYKNIKYTGFCSEEYLSSTNSSSSSATSSKTATDKAASYDSSLAGTYKTTAKINVRNGAGTSKSVMVTIPKGTSVTNYGYYTVKSNVKWLYVQFTYNKIKYTGFCSKAYLTK